MRPWAGKENNPVNIKSNVNFEIGMKILGLGEKYKQLQQLIVQLGWINTCLYAANRISNLLKLGLFFNKYYFVAQSFADQPQLPPNRGRHIRVVELGPESLDYNPCPRPKDVLADRYNQGATCLTAYREDEFAGCLWYAESRYREDEVRCVYQLPADQAVWDFDVYVEPKFRLSPVFLKLWDEASTKLTQKGSRWSFSRISAFNAMSLSSHKRMGAYVVGWAVFAQFRQTQICIASMKPFIHLSTSEFSSPVFKFSLPKNIAQ